MNKTILLYFFLSVSFTLFSQKIKLEGTVVEESSDPVENADVFIGGTILSTKTDKNGKFVFNEVISLGDHIISITKIGFVTKNFIVTVEKDKNIVIGKIKMKLTKDEKRRRWVMKKVRKDEERRIKRERKKIGGTLIESVPVKKEVVTEEVQPEIITPKVVVPKKEMEQVEPVVVTTKPKVVTISPLQEKYATKLGVSPLDITTAKLYEFINNWEGTTYLSGGETKSGIDAPSFMQRLFKEVYDIYIERTATAQYESKNTDKFSDISYLEEGDLVFFKGSGKYINEIVGVGVYLKNNKFIHSTPRKGISGYKGVKISSIKNSFWKSKFICGGRRYATSE